MNKFLILILASMLLPAAVFAQAEPEIMSYREYGKIRHKRP